MKLIGRAQEVREVRALVEASGVWLVGPPGMGKSALALALEPDVVVDFEGIASEEEARTALAMGLGCASREPLAIQRSLRAHRVVVFDAVGTVDVSPWLAHTRVVVTSRRVADTSLPVWHVGSLDPKAGAALLREGVRDARRAASLSEEALRELSKTLDGVPLALVLASSALRLHDPATIARRPLSELAGSERLSSAIEGVLQKLEDGERAVLEAAAVLVADFDLPLLELAAGRPASRDLLGLLDHALLHPQPTSPPTFRVLRPVRDALGVSANAVAEVQGRLAVRLPQLEAVAEELAVGGRAAPALAAVRWLRLLAYSVSDEVRLRAALALAAIERRLGPVTDTLARDQTLADAGPAELRARWSMAVAVAACHDFQPERAEEVLARGAIHVPPHLSADWLETRAQVAALAGRTEEALALCDEAIARDDANWRYFRKGGIHYQRGEVSLATAAFARARDGSRGFRFAQASYAHCIGLHDLGAPPHEVLADLVRAEEAVELTDFPWLAARFATVRGILHFDLGDMAAAAERLGWAQEAFLALGEADEAVNAWMLAQWVALVAGEPVGLEPPARGSRRGRVEALQAVALALSGEWERAAALAVVVERTARQRSWPDGDELCAYLSVALAAGRPELASSLCRGSWVERVQAALAGTLVPVDRNEDRVLAAIAARRGGLVRVQRDGAAMIDAGGERIDLRRRRVLRRVLEVLATAEQPLTVAAICEAVWAGEALVGDSGTRRVHVAISSLRGLGLRGAIVTHEDEEPTRWSLACPVVDRL